MTELFDHVFETTSLVVLYRPVFGEERLNG